MSLRSKLAQQLTLSDTDKVSDNVGSVLSVRSTSVERARKLSRDKTTLSTSGDVRTVFTSDHTGTTETTQVVVGQLPVWLRRKHTAELFDRWSRVENEAVRTGKPIGIIADGQTKAILADVKKPVVSAVTEKKYMRAVALMLEREQTPLEASHTYQHWNFQRSAMRFYLLREIERTRRASEVSRKHKNLESAKRRTRRAFELATVFDEMFLAPGRLTWADKAKSNKASGVVTPKKSKRYGPQAPTAQEAYVSAVGISQKLTDRHAERLFILGLFGVRPAEMMNANGIRLTVENHAGGQRLVAKVFGAKCDGVRGVEVRLCGRDENVFDGFNKEIFELFLSKVKASKGGLTVHTSDADYRSLSRLFAKMGAKGLSCYSFRHAVASDLKALGVAPEKSAVFLGHRSTKSLESYGRRSRGRGAKGYSVKASESAVLHRMVRGLKEKAPSFPKYSTPTPAKRAFSPKASMPKLTPKRN
jgi:integrase